MGLMEKALQYKKEMNSRGKETLIDKIQGPAETEMMEALPDDELIETGTAAASPDESADSLDTLLSPDDIREIRIEDDLFNLPDEETVKSAVSHGLQAKPSLDQEEKPPAGEGEKSQVAFVPQNEALGKDDASPLGPEDEPLIRKKSGQVQEPVKIHPEKTDLNNIIPRSAEKSEQAGRQNKRFHDFMVLYEIGKEIVKAETRKELYDVILFSIMGQIGASSSSILIPDSKESNRWSVADFRGITVKNTNLHFDSSAGILGSVLKKREIVDLEDYKDKPEHRDEYFEFVSIDVRLLSPLSYDGRVFGAVGLGEKITIGDYSEAEMDFILSICEIAAVALNKINTIESLGENLSRIEADRLLQQRLDELQEKISMQADIKALRETVHTEFAKMGIRSYALFLRSEKDNAFLPEIVEGEDFLSFEESGFRIEMNSPLIGYLEELKGSAIIDNFSSFEPVRAAFTEAQLKKISLMWIYTFRIGLSMDAFMAVFRIEDEERRESLQRYLRKMAMVLLPYIYSFKNIYSGDKRYLDTIEAVMRKISRSFENAKNLNIPFTLVQISIKNYKRYYNLYGYDETRQLIEKCESVITSRLSDSDFAVRLDRNRILLALPGKNKKFAIPLANTIRNEIAQTFKKKEMQLMLVYLTAGYPEDGDDLYGLIDSIE